MGKEGMEGKGTKRRQEVLNMRVHRSRALLESQNERGDKTKRKRDRSRHENCRCTNTFSLPIVAAKTQNNDTKSALSRWGTN